MAVELTQNIKDFLNDKYVRELLKADDLTGVIDLINNSITWRSYYIPPEDMGIFWAFLAEVGINIFNVYDKVESRLLYNHIQTKEVDTTGKTSVIGKDFMKGNEYVKRLVIGDNIKSIDDCAFEGCTALETVVMGDNVEIIGTKAFADCPNLHRIVLPESVRILKPDALKANDNCYIYSVPRKRGSLKAYGDLTWLKQHLGVDPSFREEESEEVAEQE